MPIFRHPLGLKLEKEMALIRLSLTVYSVAYCQWGYILIMQPIIPFMGSCGSSVTSDTKGDEGGLPVRSLSSGALHPSDSSIKYAAFVPKSADNLVPADL